MDDFELELAKLYSAERKKDLFYLESVERERQAVLSAFYDHYASVSKLQDTLTLEDILSEATTGSAGSFKDDDSIDDDAFVSPLAQELGELIQQDIQRHEVLLSGEMQVSGEGVYMFTTDRPEGTEDGMGTEILEDGATLTGDIRYYSVAPMISYDDFMRTQRGGDAESEALDVETPGLWLFMENVAVTNAAGVTTETLDRVLVPLNYPSLTFNKVIRQSDSVMAEEAQPEPSQVPVVTHFKSDFMLETCNDMENDLNHNEYDGEESHRIRAQHQDELSIYMAIVDREAPLTLSAFSAILHDGTEVALADESALYLDPVIMKINDMWRVLHAFQLVSNEGTLRIAHILPEYLLAIRNKNEQ